MVVLKWLSGCLAKERKIVEDALARNQKKENWQHRGSGKGIREGKGVVHLQSKN